MSEVRQAICANRPAMDLCALPPARQDRKCQTTSGSAFMPTVTPSAPMLPFLGRGRKVRLYRLVAVHMYLSAGVQTNLVS